MDPVLFKLLPAAGFRNSCFINAAAAQDGFPAGLVACKAVNQYVMDAQLPAFRQDQGQHLTGITLATFARKNAVADVPRVLFRLGTDFDNPYNPVVFAYV